MPAHKKASARPTEATSLRADMMMLLWGTPVLLACGYVALTPYAGALSSLRLYDAKRLLQIGLLLAGAACVTGVPRLRAGWLATFRALPRAARWGLGTVFALGVASALTAPVPRMALLDVAHYALLFNLGFAVASLCRALPRRFVQLLLVALGVGVGLYAILFARGYVVHWSGGNAGLWPEGDIGFANKRFFNQFQSWSLPLLVVLGLMPSVRRRRGGRVLASGLLACWWMLALASGGRGILLGMIVAGVGVGAFFRWKAWPWLREHLAAGAVGALLYGLLFQLIVPATGSIAERAQYKGFSSSGRLSDWQGIAEAIAGHPWLGLGPMHTAYAPSELWPTTHNAVLQFVVEWGLPAALLLVGLALWGLFAYGEQARRQLLGEGDASDAEGEAHPLLPATRVALFASMLAAGTHAMVSGVVVMPASQVAMTLVLGCALGMHLPQHSPSARPVVPARQETWALVAFLLAGAALLVWGVSPDVLSLNTRFAEGVFEHGTLRLPPRYWSYGPFGP